MDFIDKKRSTNRFHVRGRIASAPIKTRIAVLASAILIMGTIFALSTTPTNNLALLAGNGILLKQQQQQHHAFAAVNNILQQSTATADNNTTSSNTKTAPTTAIPLSNEPNHLAIIGQEAPFYMPDNLTVKSGTTVTFKNHDAIIHTATGTNDEINVSSPTANNLFDTGLLTMGQEKQVTFDKAGTYNYFCTIHPFMRGTVTVTA